jgi:hypothetical protein
MSSLGVARVVDGAWGGCGVGFSPSLIGIDAGRAVKEKHPGVERKATFRGAFPLACGWPIPRGCRPTQTLRV